MKIYRGSKELHDKRVKYTCICQTTNQDILKKLETNILSGKSDRIHHINGVKKDYISIKVFQSVRTEV